MIQDLSKRSQAVDTVCLHQLFETQANQSPDATAIIDRDVSYTYQDVEQQANQFAHYLRSMDVGPGELVGLYCDRSARAIISILGILKAGAGYVPIASSFPEDRIKHIIADTKMRVMVTEMALAECAKEHGLATLIVSDLPEQQEVIGCQSNLRLELDETGLEPNDLCYIIYTSGTTGRPKGIMTEHRNVVSFVHAFRDTCEMTPSDRVYQGFSLTFDGSVEEIWMAFSSGAALVIGPPELAQLGEETAQFMCQQDVTFFSTVPTFLAMIGQDVPTLRLVIVSGEACPQALIERWVRPGLRMLNVYGPTEATVNTTSWDCVPGVPVTIGRPLSGYTTYILDESMQPVAPGQSGELYIGGYGIARGYLNQPELTGKHFVPNIFHVNGHQGMLYRTGDLVREADDGELHFLGRIDSQVKIRGFRIELEEIESVLCEHSEIEGAILSVVGRNGSQELAAHIVTNRNDSEMLDRGEILDLLRRRLPPYMVPAYLDQIDAFPRLASGKIDRRALPDSYTRLIEEDRQIVPPETDMERKLTDLWERVFDISPISIDDNFFMDLGGDSLSATSFVSYFRGEWDEEIAVRSLYKYPTVRLLAAHIEEQQSETSRNQDSCEQPETRPTSQEVFEQQPRLHRAICYSLQSLTLIVLYVLPITTIILIARFYQGVWNGQYSLWQAGTLMATLFFFAYPAWMGLCIMVKWVAIGRYKEGSYPLWGFYYFRWWLATRFQRACGAGLLAGTPLINIFYRLMGAKVGSGCVINTARCDSFDLVTIGDRSSIGGESQLLGYHVADGMLHIGIITIGEDCFVGIQSSLAINSQMGDGALLDDLSSLRSGEVIPEGEGRQGSPARACDVAVPTISPSDVPRRRSFIFGMLSILSIYALQLFMLVASLPNLLLLFYAYSLESYVIWTAILLISMPVFELSFWMLHILVKACVMRQSHPGVYRVDSFYYMRKWFVNAMMGFSRLFTLPVYTTLYMLPLLRMLGAKIGARAELSVIAQLSPDLVVMEEESFFADGSIIGGMRTYKGHVQLATNRIGRRSFVGNSAVLPVGGTIGSGCLLGVLSSPPVDTENVPDKSEWLGSPSFALPNRTKVDSFSDEQIYKPSAETYASRLCVDALRIFTSSSIEIIGLVALVGFLIWSGTNLSLVATLALAPVLSIALTALMVLCVVAVKRMAIGTFKPEIQPLWSPYVWLNEVINGAHESVASPLLSPLLGTPFFVFYLRLIGCKVGKHVFIETEHFGEFDLVEIGDYVALNRDVVIQNHLFEDRVFKSSRLVIGDNCSIGNMSVILYDSEMGEGSSIAPLSLLMKGESIPPRTQWEGIPIQNCTLETQ